MSEERPSIAPDTDIQQGQPFTSDLTPSNPTYHCYVIEVIGANSSAFTERETSELRQAFKKHVKMHAEDEGCIEITDRIYTTSKSMKEWSKAYRVHVSTLITPERKTDDGAALLSTRVLKTSNGNEQFNTYMTIDFKKASFDSGGKLLVANASDISVSIPDGPSHLDIDTASTKEILSKEQRNLKPGSVGPHRIARVFARRIPMTISQLRERRKWAQPHEASLIRHMENKLVVHLTEAVYQQASKSKKTFLVSGNRLFASKATQLNCGVMKRHGHKLRLVLKEDNEPQVIGIPCERLFFRPIQVSEFIAQYLPAQNDYTNSSTIKTLNRVLKGVLVVSLTSALTSPTAIQAIVNSTANQLQIPALGTEPPTLSLAKVFTSKTGKALRYANMPCINIGSQGRPFYLPAEACKILPDQSFRHRVDGLPLSSDDEVFEKQLQRSIANPKHVKITNLEPRYKDVDLRGFAICFAEIVVVPPGSDSSNIAKYSHLHGDAWQRFKHEFGQRFGGILGKATADSRSIVIPFTPGCGDLLDSASSISEALRRGVPGSKRVLIACIPTGENNSTIYTSLRRLCDIELGIQCNVVTAKEVMKRANAPSLPSANTLVPYAGSVMRAALGKALVPPQPDSNYQKSEGFKQHYTAHKLADAETPKRGLAVGIHVQRLQDIIGAGIQMVDAADCYLVTVCSYLKSLHASDSDQKIRTSHELVSAIHVDLAVRVQKCVSTHLETIRENLRAELDESSSFDFAGLCKATQGGTIDQEEQSFQHIVFYRSGFGADDRLLTSAEVHGLEFESKDSGTSHACKVHLAYVSAADFVLDDPSNLIETDNFDDINCVVRHSPNSAFLPTDGRSTRVFHLREGDIPSEAQTAVLDNLDDPFGFNQAMRETFIRSQVEIEQGEKLFEITYCHEMRTDKQEESEEYSTLYEQLKAKALKPRIVQQYAQQMARFNDHTPGYDVNTNTARLTGHVFHTVVKKTVLPDILFLAQKASRRIARYVQAEDDAKLRSGEMPFFLPAVHEDLRTSLYFL